MPVRYDFDSDDLITGQRVLIECMKCFGFEGLAKGVCWGYAHMSRQAILAQQYQIFNARLELLNTLLTNAYKAAFASHSISGENQEDAIHKVLDEYQSELFANAQLQLRQGKQINDVFLDTLHSTLFKAALNSLSAKLKKQGIEPENLHELLKKRFDENNKHLFSKVKFQFQQGLTKLNTNDRNGIHGFFDGVMLYQNPNKSKFVFPEFQKVSQRLLSAFDLVSPSKADSNYNLKELGLINAYSRKDLIEYFDSLREILRNQLRKLNFPLTLVLGSEDHAITIGYDNVNGDWLFSEANQTPIQSTKSEAELADRVLKGFLVKKQELAVFSTSIFTTKTAASTVSQHVKPWHTVQNTFHMTKEKADKMNLLTAIAIEREDSKKLAALLKNGANPNNRISDFPFLIYATYIGNLVSVQILLDEGADPNAKSKTNAIALHYAVSLGLNDVCDLLIKYKSDINAIGQLHISSINRISEQQKCSKEKLYQILNLPANTTQTPEKINGLTPLHLAVLNNRIEVFKLLLENGADRSIKTEAGVSALDIAQGMNHYSIVNLLENKQYVPHKFARLTPVQASLGILARQTQPVIIIKKDESPKIDTDLDIDHDDSPQLK